MNNSNSTQQVQITTADPSALGLFGLAMVTLVASSAKLGWTDGVSFVLPWAIRKYPRCLHLFMKMAWAQVARMWVFSYIGNIIVAAALLFLSTRQDYMMTRR